MADTTTDKEKQSEGEKKRRDFLRTDGVIQSLWNYASSNEGQNSSAQLNEKRYTIKQTGMSYRVANHWTEEGLLDDERPEGKGWRKFSLLDLVWLHTYGTLRNFGLPLDLILKARASAHQAPFPIYKAEAGKEATYEIQSLPVFEFYVLAALTQRRPVLLIVFDDGDAAPLTFKEYVLNATTSALRPHVVVPLNSILQSLLPSKDLAPIYDHHITLNPDELKVLSDLRRGNYESFTIWWKNGRMQTIEAQELVDVDRLIVDILQDRAFQNIEIVQRDSTIVRIKRKILEKVW